MAADGETNVPPSGGAGGTDQSPPGAGDATAGLPLPPATGGRDTEGVAGLGVLVADRDGAVATRLAGLLREAGAGDVAHCADQETFLQAVRSDPARWHVALWHEDLEPDTRRRLGLLNTWQREFPGTAVVLTTDALTSASTLTALRGGAAEIVPRSASGAELAAVVRHAHEAHRLRHAPAGHPEPPRMLVVGAHPDDGEIGAGGLIHRRVRDGWEITMLAMSHGSFGGDPGRRVEEARRAAAMLGASFHLEDFPDGHITDATETVQAIERTVSEVSPDVVLVARAAPRFAGAGVRTLVSDAAALERCLDKWALAETCRETVRVPRTVLLEEGVADRFGAGFPAVAKPRRGSGSRGIVMAAAPAALTGLPHDRSYLLQELLPGTEYSVDVLVAPDGGVRAAVPRARDKTDSGIIVAGHVLDRPGLSRLAAGVASALGLRGICNVQVREDREGLPALLEVNPRPPGGMSLTVAAGVQMPAWAVAGLLGAEVPGRIAHHALSAVRHWEDVVMGPDGLGDVAGRA
ncbi:ATP-grasp domain-containing protein [Streptomyces sp. NPDC057381]|uniref:ATP-grasp domain-containing protein n=1 Tax=Streptomyces sp. NPDC057381 TaxID=3346111 RepID=UPI003645E48F